jgi:hypothetical protein
MLALLTVVVSAHADIPDTSLFEAEVSSIEPEANTAHSEATAPDTEPDVPDPERRSIWRVGADWAVDSRDSLAEDIHALARSLDGFFGGERAHLEANDSYMRLRLANTFTSGEGAVDQSDLKFRLSLPATSDRFGLFFENMLEEDESLTERSQASTVQQGSTDRRGFSAALQFFSRKRESWRASLNAGVVTRIPIDPFVRQVVYTDWNPFDAWSLNTRQRITYFHSTGYDASSRWTLGRPLNDFVHLRFETEAGWRQEADTLELVEKINLLVQVDQDNAVDYQLAVLQKSRSHMVVDTGFLSATLRTRLYRDWLYMEWVPELAFPREDRYRAEASFTLRLEVQFRPRITARSADSPTQPAAAEHILPDHPDAPAADKP